MIIWTHERSQIVSEKKLFIYPCHLFVYCHDESVTSGWHTIRDGPSLLISDWIFCSMHFILSNKLLSTLLELFLAWKCQARTRARFDPSSSSCLTLAEKSDIYSLCWLIYCLQRKIPSTSLLFRPYGKPSFGSYNWFGSKEKQVGTVWGSTWASLGVVSVVGRVKCPPRDEVTQQKWPKAHFHSSMTIFEFFSVLTTMSMRCF